MKFQLEIELGNDAMQTPGHIATALHNIARDLNNINSYSYDTLSYTPIECGEQGRIADENGNSVGKWEVVKDLSAALDAAAEQRWADAHQPD